VTINRADSGQENEPQCRPLEETVLPSGAELLLCSMVGLAVAHASDPRVEGAAITKSLLDFHRAENLPHTGLTSFARDLQRTDWGVAWRARLVAQLARVKPSRVRIWLADECIRGSVVPGEELVGTLPAET
jgi:hypothetical protein